MAAEALSTVMDITVILCTWNRCESLAKALESLSHVRLSESVNWEVLVVDNNSNDNTRGVVARFSQHYPGRFRYLFEPKPGKSHALNAGIREAGGDVLAFVDDDVVVDEAWLGNLTGSLCDENPWAGAGGRTLLAESFLPPPWLALNGPYGMGGILAGLFDLGGTPCELTQAPFGTNMAFRRSLFEKCGGFRTDLGPSPSRAVPRPNEDTEFGRRVMATGGRLRYEPGAIVYHQLPKDRIAKDYFLAWWFDSGRASVRERGIPAYSWGIPRQHLWMIKALGTIVVSTLAWQITFRTEKRFHRKCWVWKTAGNISEMYRSGAD